MSAWCEEAWTRHCRIVREYGNEAGSDADRRFLTLALAGEVGELANIIKKTWRGDFSVDDRRTEISEELADIRIYLEILARALGVDLDRACETKTLVLRKRWPDPQ